MRGGIATFKGLALLLVLILTGCFQGTMFDTTEYPLEVKRVERKVFRFIDREAGVVCYSIPTAMDCLPLNQTNLE